MVYCELCEKEYSEVKYLSHLDKCIQSQRLFTKEGIPNKKVPIIFKVFWGHFGYERIISYLNSVKSNDYVFKGRPLGDTSSSPYQDLILSGSWLPFLYDAAPNIITFAYIHALRSRENEIGKTARNNIAFMFSYLAQKIYLSPYEEAKPGILSFLVNLLKNEEAQDFLKQKYRAMSVVEKYDIKRWASRVVDEHSPYSEYKERMNHEKKILAFFISRIYSPLKRFEWGLPDWNDEKEKIYVDFDILSILGFHRHMKPSSFEDIHALVNEFYEIDADEEETWISLDNMERKELVKAEKRTINSKPRLFYNLTPRGYDLLTEYAKQFDKQPREPGEPNLKPSSESDFKKFLKGQ